MPVWFLHHQFEVFVGGGGDSAQKELSWQNWCWEDGLWPPAKFRTWSRFSFIPLGPLFSHHPAARLFTRGGQFFYRHPHRLLGNYKVPVVVLFSPKYF